MNYCIQLKDFERSFGVIYVRLLMYSIFLTLYNNKSVNMI